MWNIYTFERTLLSTLESFQLHQTFHHFLLSESIGYQESTGDPDVKYEKLRRKTKLFFISLIVLLKVWYNAYHLKRYLIHLKLCMHLLKVSVLPVRCNVWLRKRKKNALKTHFFPINCVILIRYFTQLSTCFIACHGYRAGTCLWINFTQKSPLLSPTKSHNAIIKSWTWMRFYVLLINMADIRCFS